MDWDTNNHSLALAILATITVLNTGLAFNFVSANGSALAAAFNGRNIYALAGVEMVLVLLTYVVSKHRGNGHLQRFR
jgi:hypothetical protein